MTPAPYINEDLQLPENQELEDGQGQLSSILIIGGGKHLTQDDNDEEETPEDTN